MLKTRVIPTLLWKDFGLVKGVGFDSWRRVGSVQPAIQVYTLREVDELILLDIAASGEQAEIDLELLADYAALCSVPLTVGGGVRSLAKIQALLQAGADKVSINSAVYQDIDLLRQASLRFGVQCIVGSIDVRAEDGVWHCYSHCGQVKTSHHPVEWAKKLVDAGAGEILLTSIDRDGTLSGYDLSLIKAVVEAVNVPVIASGGAGNYEHMREAIQCSGASAVAAASMFHFTEQTPKDAKAYLNKHGVAVRM
jgi:cyclase